MSTENPNQVSNQIGGKPTFSADAPPEVILKVLVDEIARPVISIEATAKILLSQPSSNEYWDMLHRIPLMTDYLKSLLDAAHEYIAMREKINKD